MTNMIEVISASEAITFRKRLGSGGFGDVYAGTFRGQPVAIKKLKTETKNPTASLESFQAETSLPTLDHRNVIKILAASSMESPDKLIIMELIGGSKTLQTLIDLEETARCWQDYVTQITSALAFIHERNIVHLDLKPTNVLVNEDQVCKLADFGCCQIVNDQPPSPSFL